MKLTNFNDSDTPQLEKWMQYEEVLYYCITEKSNPQLPFYSWAVRSNNKLFGWANLFNIDIDNLKAEYGLILPDEKPVKLAYNVTIAVLKFSFNKLGLNRVYVRPLASNLRQNGIDQRERFGFVREGVERQSVKRGDIYEDVVVMSILREEFERRGD